MKYLLPVILSVAVLSTGCAGANIFPAIGAKMSNPITIAIDSTNARLYVVNSDYQVQYGNGSVHVVDITDPSRPAMVDYAVMPAFSGEAYVDPAKFVLFMTNRSSANSVDTLYGFNVNESAGAFLEKTDYATDGDPFGLVCCDTNDRLYVATQAGKLDYYNRNDPTSHGSIDLMTELSTGVATGGAGALRVVIMGSQAIVSKADGGAWIVNLDEVGVAGKYPVDYFIYDIGAPAGMATDGTYLYIAAIEDGTPSLLILDISTLTPRTDNTTTELVSKADSNLLVTPAIPLSGDNPQGLVLANNKVYIAQQDSASVAVVDLSTYLESETIGVGDSPYEMALYSPTGTPAYLFVANSGSNTVSVIRLSDDKVVGTYP